MALLCKEEIFKQHFYFKNINLFDPSIDSVGPVLGFKCRPG